MLNHKQLAVTELEDDCSETILETEEEIRQALLKSKQASPNENPSRIVQPFCPENRPPIPILTVYDDGQVSGEVIRIRNIRFEIGRTEGDLCIGFDRQISARHVEIAYKSVDRKQNWCLTDLNSRHGTYVRVRKTLLLDKAEIMIGGGRYRFEAAATTKSSSHELSNFSSTAKWQGENEGHGLPSLVEITKNGYGNRLILERNEYWLGAAPVCSISRPSDNYCDLKHARLYRNPQGKWYADHNNSENGLWRRMNQLVVSSSVQFRIGEQLFLLRINH